MSKTLIIGGNRGIGLELSKQLIDRGDDVITVSRSDSEDLGSLNCRVISGIDVSNQTDVDTLCSEIGNDNISLLIHSAGILTNENLDDLNIDRIRAQFETNTLGPLRVISGLRGNLKAGAKVGILSSRVGSLDDNGSGGMYGYRISKTAVNMVGVNLAHDLRQQQVALALLHPGLVATEMTGHRGIDPKDSARGLIQRMDQLTLETTGKFWHAEGEILPW